jgi:hypothetical protein
MNDHLALDLPLLHSMAAFPSIELEWSGGYFGFSALVDLVAGSGQRSV